MKFNRISFVGYTILFLTVFSTVWLSAQPKFQVEIILDNDRGSKELAEQFKVETKALLEYNYKLQFVEGNPISTIGEARTSIQKAQNSSANLIVTIGLISSKALVDLGTYNKPSIAGIALGTNENETSGIHNFSYVESPFSIEDDLKMFQQLTKINHLSIYLNELSEKVVKPYLDAETKQFNFTVDYVSLSQSPLQDVEKLNSETDGVYLLPVLYNQSEKDTELIQGLNKKKIPTFSFIGREDVENGALAGLANNDNLSAYARKLAIDVLKVADGQNPKDFSTKIVNQENDFVINMATAREVGVSPSFDLLLEASLLNIDKSFGQELSLQGAILETLENNLEYDIAKANVDLQENNIRSAKGSLYPDLSVSTSAALLDNQTANAAPTTSELTWQGDLNLTQIIYSEPVYANIAIQKFLSKAQTESYNQTALDVTLNTASLYLQYLQANANLVIQQNNVEITKSNLDLAKTKEKVGQSSPADTYRLESQLAQNKVSLNDALTALEQIKYSLNFQLNRPKNQDFSAKDVSPATQGVLLTGDPRISDKINNRDDLERLADFLVKYAFENVPPIKQIDYNIQARERSLKSNQRSLYLPQFSAGAGLNSVFGRYLDHPSDVELNALGIDPNQPTWNVGVSVSLPIFQGFTRKANIESDKISLQQLNLEKENTEALYETNIRTSLENLANSYTGMLLTEKSAEAAQNYLSVIQNLYREGAANITTLLDAQNASLSAELNAAAVRYQLMIDAFTLENAIGFIYLTATDEQKDEFFQALQNEVLILND